VTPAEPGPGREGVVEYHFPVVIEIRETPAADAGDVAEQVTRKLVSDLTG
jgi:hypothetical protein